MNNYFTTSSIFTKSLSTSSTTPLPPVSISSLENPYEINWGNWGPFETCDDKDYVVGFRSKLQSEMDADKTGLNGVELICLKGKKLKSSEGQWGSWDTKFNNCQNGQSFIGFVYGMEKKQGFFQDDSSTNIIRLICSDGSIISSLEGAKSSSLITVRCPYGVIVGLKTQIEPIQYFGDNTALNNIEYLCKII